MATGLIGERAGSQPREPGEPRQLQRPRPEDSRPGQLKPGRPGEPQRTRPGQLKPGRPGEPQRTRPGQLKPGRPGEPQRTRPGQLKPGRPGELQRGRPAARPATTEDGASRPAAERAPALRPQARSRTPFVLLLVGLLSGGLVCLLLINTTLAEGSFQITAMQQKNAALAQQETALQQQTAAQESPASIAARAQQLGMRPVGRLRFLDLKNGRIYNEPAHEPGVTTVPGYTP